MRPVALRLGVGVLWCALAPACSDALGVEDVIGIWNTQTINGYGVPGTVVYEGRSHEAEYVRWVFYDGGQCTLTQRVDGATATFDECDYTIDVKRGTIHVVLQFEAWAGNVARHRMTLTDPQDIVWTLGTD